MYRTRFVCNNSVLRGLPYISLAATVRSSYSLPTFSCSIAYPPKMSKIRVDTLIHPSTKTQPSSSRLRISDDDPLYFDQEIQILDSDDPRMENICDR